jgi:hypothetical protein
VDMQKSMVRRKADLKIRTMTVRYAGNASDFAKNQNYGISFILKAEALIEILILFLTTIMTIAFIRSACPIVPEGGSQIGLRNYGVSDAFLLSSNGLPCKKEDLPKIVRLHFLKNEILFFHRLPNPYLIS